MRKPRVKFDYSKLTDSEVLAFAKAVNLAITVNVGYFPTPFPTLINLAGATTTYETALSNAATRDKTAVADKDEKKDVLVLLLADLAAYVNNVASGDEVKLVSSGFELAKQAEPNPPIEAPTNLLVEAGINTGEIALSIDRVKGALSYNFQITPGPLTDNSLWETQPCSRRKFVFQNLEIGKTYWFRVAAVGPRDQITYCNPQGRAAA